MNKQNGFTLVELVTVIILIGILAVTVLPKFDGTDNYEVYPFRAQLISALRLTQQRAMQETGTCHQIVFDSAQARYGVPNRADCLITAFPANWKPDLTGAVIASRYNITFAISGKTNPQQISFDYMGRPLSDCAGGCLINITQTEISETVQIKIESEGFIHAL